LAIRTEPQPEIFSGAARAGDEAAGDARGELLGAAELTADRPGRVHLDTGDEVPGGMFCQTCPHGFHLGQLRHRYRRLSARRGARGTPLAPPAARPVSYSSRRSEEHTSELQSR